MIINAFYVFSTDGGGMGYEVSPIGYFTRENDARTIHEANPFTGYRKVKLIKHDDKYYVLAASTAVPINVNIPEEKERLKKQALAKLSPAEAAALGIDNT